jgi:sialate O-acetylesterase
MLCVLLASWTMPADAAVKLPAIFGDNMVLQQGRPVPVWGWADKDEDVTVILGRQQLSTKAGPDGRWKVALDKLDLGEPLTLTVKGSSGSEIALKNILVGEVWICSGQSNMELGVDACNKAAEEIAAADFPKIRLFRAT